MRLIYFLFLLLMSKALTPAEITQKSIDVGVEKTSNPLKKTLISGILAGMYIGIGAMFSINSITGLEGIGYGIVKLIAGLTFCIGLVLVMIAGAELFTGNAMIMNAWLAKKISFGKWMKNLGIIWLANLVGALLLIGFLVVGGRYGFDHGGIAETIIGIGAKKIHYGWFQALSLGILCNILVCLGVWLARAGKSVTDKVMGILFPVTAFVACGFEHSVANMFYLPFAYVLKMMGMGSVELADLTIGTMLWNNLLPVTIGNIIGGGIFVGALYWRTFQKKKEKAL